MLSVRFWRCSAMSWSLDANGILYVIGVAIVIMLCAKSWWRFKIKCSEKRDEGEQTASAPQ